MEWFTSNKVFFSGLAAISALSSCSDANVGRSSQDSIQFDIEQRLDTFVKDANPGNVGLEIEEDIYVCVDNDKDNFYSTKECGPVDCDDFNNTIFPDAIEICDYIDNNCNGITDEDAVIKLYADKDNDGQGVSSDFILGCKEEKGRVANDYDCNDNNEKVFLNAVELCDTLDNNCNDLIDEGFELNKNCYVGVGECEAMGKSVCTEDGLYTVCNVDPAEAIEELCDGLDNDCDGSIDEDFVNIGLACSVGVGDCLTTGVYDCNEDKDATICYADSVNPALEVCDLKDNDCDGFIDEGLTLSQICGESSVGECTMDIEYSFCLNGSYSEWQGCGAVFPTSEVCDSQDNDCDGMIDEDYLNKGEACELGVGECVTIGTYVCENDEISCYVGNMKESTLEVCDNLDNDCDGFIDEGLTLSQICGTSEVGVCAVGKEYDFCFEGAYTGWQGCDAVFPTLEVCDNLDNDCNGLVDEGLTISIACGVSDIGECNYGTQVSTCEEGEYSSLTPCLAVLPSMEICDGLDNDCDGMVDEDLTLSQICGTSEVGECSLGEESNYCVDGAYTGWLDCDAKLSSTEVCDDLDNDCNGIVDDGLKIEFNLDNDKDGFGGLSSIMACSKPEGYVSNKDDCNDFDKEINPDALEVCDLIDNDCDGLIDEDNICIEIIDDFNRPSGNIGNNLLGHPWSNYGDKEWTILEEKYAYVAFGPSTQNPSSGSEIGHRSTFNMIVKFKLSEVNAVGGGGAFVFGVNCSGDTYKGNTNGLVAYIAMNNSKTHKIRRNLEYIATGEQVLKADTNYLMRFSFDGDSAGLKLWEETKEEPADYLISTQTTNVDLTRSFVTILGDMDKNENGSTKVDYIIDEKN